VTQVGLIALLGKQGNKGARIGWNPDRDNDRDKVMIRYVELESPNRKIRVILKVYLVSLSCPSKNDVAFKITI
jgi:hypothetical protein